jgi:hypothetical protein
MIPLLCLNFTSDVTNPWIEHYHGKIVHVGLVMTTLAKAQKHVFGEHGVNSSTIIVEHYWKKSVQLLLYDMETCLLSKV